MRNWYVITLLLLSFPLFAQNPTGTQNATFVGKSEKMVERPSIASQVADGTFVPAEEINREVNPKKRGANKAVPGKGLPVGIDPLWDQQKSATTFSGPEPLLTFEAASGGATPTDPTGAVGPNHYVNAWNVAFRIFDKTGSPLTDPASLGTIWPGETAGDPIVFYDQFADRFVITQFTFQNGFLIAISQGPDPVNDGWYTYQFLIDAFPDYPKFSVWSDGYYITANKNSGSAGFSEVVYVIERDEIIAGDTEAQIVGFPLTDIVTSGFYSPLGFNVTGNTLPPPGNSPIVYMQDDVWSGVEVDHLKVWTINVDWEAPKAQPFQVRKSLTLSLTMAFLMAAHSQTSLNPTVRIWMLCRLPSCTWLSIAGSTITIRWYSILWLTWMGTTIILEFAGMNFDRMNMVIHGPSTRKVLTLNLRDTALMQVRCVWM